MTTKIIQKLVKANGNVFRVKEGTGPWSPLQTTTPVATAGDSFDCSNYRLSKKINIKKNAGFKYREVTIFKFSAKGGYKSLSDVVTYEKLDTTWSGVGSKPTWWDTTDMFSQVEIYSDAPVKNALSSVSENACDITISSSADYYNGNNSEIFNKDSLVFNGGFAYTVPRKPSSYSWVHNGAISWSVNNEKSGALSIWFKPSAIPSDHEIYNGGRMYLLSRRVARNMADWSLSFNFSDGLHFYQYTTGSGDSYINQYFGGNIQLDQWHHVVLRHYREYNLNKSIIDVYLNGQLLGTKSKKKIKDEPAYYMAIGTRVTTMRKSSAQFNTSYAASDSRFYGYMKDYWFTDYTIPSAAQVATMYNNGDFKKPPFAGYNPYSAHWPLTANSNGYIGGSTNRFTDRFIHPQGTSHPLGNGNLQSVAQIKYSNGVTPI